MKLRILNRISFLNGLVFYAPVVYLIRESRGLHASEIFFLLSISSLATLFLEIPTGYITDKIGTSKSLFIAQLFLFGTRLLFAFAGSFQFYVIEMIFFAIAQAFFSGTLSACIYHVDKENYMYNVAKNNQRGTIGFFVSTLLFIPLVHISGYTLLIIATVIASSISFILSFGLLGSNREEQKESNKVLKNWNQIQKPAHFLYFMYMKAVIGLIFLSINYFYIVNLLKMNIDITYISLIIICFSLLQMTAPRIINLIKKQETGCAIFLIVTIFLLFMQTSTISIINLVAMIMLPLTALMLSIIIDNFSQKYIDNQNLNASRSTVLSMMNIGVVLFDFLFLRIYGESISYVSIDVLNIYLVLAFCLLIGSVFGVNIIKHYIKYDV